jgi:hypothetical protein
MRLTVPVFQVEDSTNSCGGAFAGGYDRHVQQSSIDSIEFPDRNGDSIPNLVIEASVGSKLITEEEREACIKTDEKPGRVFHVPTRRYKLEFTFDGRQYIPTAQTRVKLKAFPEPRLP